MAKRKRKTQTQKNITTYNRYKLALTYYGIDIKELKRPTIKSINKVKQIWRQNNKKLKKAGFIDLPTVYEASSFVKEISTPTKKQSVSRETLYNINIDNETIADIEDTNISTELQDLIDEIIDVKGERLDVKPTKSQQNNLSEARDKMLNQLNYGRQKLGDYEFLKALKESEMYGHYTQAVKHTKYMYQEADAIEQEGIPLLQSIIEQAVAKL